jgi:uncharacterized DUF497 family protein
MDRVFGCDPAKRRRLLAERGLDLLAMAEVFADSRRLDYVDERFDYGEARRVTIGWTLGRAFTVIYTQRGSLTWLITAWPSSKKERERYDRR